MGTFLRGRHVGYRENIRIGDARSLRESGTSWSVVLVVMSAAVSIAVKGGDAVQGYLVLRDPFQEWKVVFKTGCLLMNLAFQPIM